MPAVEVSHLGYVSSLKVQAAICRANPGDIEWYRVRLSWKGGRGLFF